MPHHVWGWCLFIKALLLHAQIEGYKEDVAGVLCKSTPDMPNTVLSKTPHAYAMPHSTALARIQNTPPCWIERYGMTITPVILQCVAASSWVPLICVTSIGWEETRPMGLTAAERVLCE